MKWICAAMFTMSLFLSACASNDSASDASMTSSAPVPGEKTGDSNVEPTAGPGGAGANVHF